MGTAARQRRFVFTARQLLVAILFVAIFAMAVRQPADTDTWWHLKSGQLMWESGQILRADPFSHTVQGQPWINHGWLVQILLWPLYQALGLAGLALLLATLVTASFVLVYTQCEGKPFVAAFATLIGAVASSVIWAVRPQIVSLLLAAARRFPAGPLQAQRIERLAVAPAPAGGTVGQLPRWVRDCLHPHGMLSGWRDAESPHHALTRQAGVL